MENLVGKTFGRWTVLELLPDKNSDGRTQYLCECSCEAHTKKAVSSKTLKAGTSQSCGCLRRKRASEANRGNTHGKMNAQDLTNKKFGNLLAINKLDTKKNGSWEWKCQCDCGNEVISNTRDLNAGRKTRCNNCSALTTTSKGKQAIVDTLRKHNIFFIQQYTFNSCRFPDTLQLAKFDFYVNNNYLIEFDGEQHYKLNNSSAWKDKESKINEHDSFKDNWCKENNITLIRIPYTRLQKLVIDDLMPSTSQFIKVQAT